MAGYPPTMGVSLENLAGSFFIDGLDKERARRELRQRIPAGQHSYVRDEWRDAGTLEELLFCWRWQADVDPESGDVVDLHFCGENVGEDEVMFGALAPFVRAGSYLEMDAEGDRWLWSFDGAALETKRATISYE